MVTENKKDKYSLTNYRLGNDAVQIRKQIFFRFFKDLNFIAIQNFVTFLSIFQCQIKAEIFKITSIRVTQLRGRGWPVKICRKFIFSYKHKISIWLFCDESENSWYANHGSVSGLGHKLSEGSMHSRQTYEFKSS